MRRVLISWQAAYILVTTALFVFRVVAFAAQYGAVEHDSGWYLGIARNLAERGIYASYTNTIREDGVGAHPSIHGRFSVQDQNGYSYSPAGVTVGPGYIVPEALLLKIFGHGFWSYRLWPLLGFAALLSVLFSIVLWIGGVWSLAIFQTWLWSIPQATTTFAYEAYSEHIALLYLLLSFLLAYRTSFGRPNYVLAFLGGLLFSLSFLTKNLFLLTGGVFIIWPFWELVVMRHSKRVVALKTILFLLGFGLPVLSFEIYRYLYLTSKFGYAGWHAVNEDIKLHFQQNGSSLSILNITDIPLDFILKKLSVWKDVGINNYLLAWIALFLSGPLLFKRTEYKFLTMLLYIASIISFAWFVALSPTGWARHAWHSLIIGMILCSALIGRVMESVFRKNKIGLSLVVVIVSVVLSSINWRVIDISPNLSRQTIERWRENRYQRGLEGFPSTPILSLEDQMAVVNFFEKNVRLEDRVYYVGWFLNAEISTLVNKVFYPLDRYPGMHGRLHEQGESYIIFGPYQQGEWSFMSRSYISIKTKDLCQEKVFQNPSYIICVPPPILNYTNNAYE